MGLILRTERKRFTEKLKALAKWLKQNRHRPIGEIMARVNKVILGHYNYYGVVTNTQALVRFAQFVRKILFKWLNRRSQRKSYTWETFNSRVMERFPMAKPGIYVHV
jgi:hypothetical protein